MISPVRVLALLFLLEGTASFTSHHVRLHTDHQRLIRQHNGVVSSSLPPTTAVQQRPLLRLQVLAKNEGLTETRTAVNSSVDSNVGTFVMSQDDQNEAFNQKSSLLGICLNSLFQWTIFSSFYFYLNISRFQVHTRTES